MSSHNKALVLSAPLCQYHVESRRIPTPGPGQLLVKVFAATLNPIDWKQQEMGFFENSYPFFLGSMARAWSWALAASISQGWHEEAKVFHGTFQQFLPVPAYLASKISTSIPFDEAAPFFSCLATASISMYCQQPGVQSLKLSEAPWAGGQGAYAGKSLFIVGGAGNVGQFVIQFAKWSGFGRIITTALPRNQDLLRPFGATHVINRMLPADKIVEDVEAIANGPVGIVYDAVSEKSTVQLATAALHHGGQLVLVLPGAEVAIKDVIEENKIQIVSAMGRMSGVNQDALASFWDKLPECLEKGLIKPVPYEVLPGGLSAIPTRLERLRNDQVSALKLVVLPANTE